MLKMKRETRETKINLELNLQGQGIYNINTGIGFFDHMLELWSRHGFFDLNLSVQGDLEVDGHHTIEDTGILLGQSIDRELGERKNITRYGHIILPMDESLVLAAIDLSGRSYYQDNLQFASDKVGQFPVEMFSEFFRAVCNYGRFNLHFQMMAGRNTHHLIEACFKAFARVLDQATQLEDRLAGESLSTKGSLAEKGVIEEGE